MRLLLTILISGARGALGVLVLLKAVDYLSEGLAMGTTQLIIVAMVAYGMGAILMSHKRSKLFLWLFFFGSLALLPLWLIFENAALEDDRLFVVSASSFGILISGIALLAWDGVLARQKAREEAAQAEAVAEDFA